MIQQLPYLLSLVVYRFFDSSSIVWFSYLVALLNIHPSYCPTEIKHTLFTSYLINSMYFNDMLIDLFLFYIFMMILFIIYLFIDFIIGGLQQNFAHYVHFKGAV